MKKAIISLITICTLLIVCTSSVFADDTYVPSIDVKHDVVLIDGEATDYNSTLIRIDPDGCEVYIVVTPYVYRDTIESQQSIEEIELAYKDMKEAEDILDMAPVLKQYSKKLGIDDQELILSNLFDVTLYVHEGGTHDASYEHKHIYNIRFTTEDLLNFVCLMHYDAYNDLWEIVEDARITGENRDIVTFSWDCASPFAIVSKKRERAYNHGNIIPSTGVDGGPIHKCIVDFNGHCYCLEIIVFLVISLFFNVYFILKIKEDKKQINEKKQ